MPDRRLLALSYCFPPIAQPEAPLAAKRLRHLPGWRADVVAAAPYRRSMGFDGDLATYAEQGVATVVRLAPRIDIPWRRLGLLGRMPDEFRWLNGKVVRAARAMGLPNYNAMLSWSQFHSVHLAALRIARRAPALPWIAYFSDPWADNPYMRAGALTDRINLALERRVIGRADRVIFTTPETLELVMAKYPDKWRDKARIVPHGFDPALYSGDAPPQTPGRVRVARYLGKFYGLRSPEPLFRALAAALSRDARLPGRLRVEIIGHLDAGMDATSAARALPPGFVSLRPPVSYRESLHLMATADMLLIVDASAAISVFLPSKLVDYLGADRPIVGLTPPGAAARVLREAGEEVADPADPEAGAAALLRALDRAQLRSDRRSAVRNTYTAEATGRNFAHILDELVDHSR